MEMHHSERILEDYMTKVIDFYQKIRDGKYTKYNLTPEIVKEVGDKIGVDWTTVDFGEFMQGVKEELEHGCTFAVAPDPNQTNVTGDDLESTAKIALAHLYEVTDYYTRLEQLEDAGEAHWENNDPKQWIQDNYAKNSDVLGIVGL
jgi:hypothetical protein